MKNEYGREISSFTSLQSKSCSQQHHSIPTHQGQKPVVFYDTISSIFDAIPITSGMTLSFHHHLRNGDGVMNMVLAEIQKRKLKDMILAPSSIFPVHAPLVSLINQQSVVKIFTNYVNGPVADAISDGRLRDGIIMDTHGGRPRAIEAGELQIDVAFLACPAVDSLGNGSGKEGPSACGALGYAIADLMYAKHTVLVTDHLIDHLDNPELSHESVDYVVKVPQIGDPTGIVSGTTRPTRYPVARKIAKDTVQLMAELGLIRQGFSVQTGAGGTSLAVAHELGKYMRNHQIQGKFASGGITSFLVKMLEEGLFKDLYDVQCFDLEAVRSYRENPHHHALSASEYANPWNAQAIIKQLDVVLLSAAEIDLDFHVNVTTDSLGRLIGGSGGHADTAAEAKVTIITTNLLKARQSMIQKRVRTLTTPGNTIDVVVTERGIAIHPKRQDLMMKLQGSKLKIVSIDQLYANAITLTGEPTYPTPSQQVIGVVRHRDGTILDTLFKRSKVQ